MRYRLKIARPLFITALQTLYLLGLSTSLVTNIRNWGWFLPDYFSPNLLTITAQVQSLHENGTISGFWLILRDVRVGYRTPWVRLRRTGMGSIYAKLVRYINVLCGIGGPE